MDRIGQSVCPCCGTDASLNYQHDPDCKCNTPGSVATASRFWEVGAKDARAGEADIAFVHEKMSTEECVAYMQGYLCTRRRMHRESLLLKATRTLAPQTATRPQGALSSKKWVVLKVKGVAAGESSAKENAFEIVAEACNRYQIGAGEVQILYTLYTTSGFFMDLMVYTDQKITAEVTVNVPSAR